MDCAMRVVWNNENSDNTWVRRSEKKFANDRLEWSTVIPIAKGKRRKSQGKKRKNKKKNNDKNKCDYQTHK